jgi:hypothetical protein
LLNFELPGSLLQSPVNLDTKRSYKFKQSTGCLYAAINLQTDI